MAIDELNVRIQSLVPGPVSRYGYALSPESSTVALYDGQLLPKFLLDHGVDPSEYPTILRQNRIGSVFEELEPGQAIVLPMADEKTFLKHPEA